MSEFSEWFEKTFKDCYCDKGNLVNNAQFSEIVQLILDNEADEKSMKLFEEKLKSCLQTSNRYKDEKSLQESIKNKLTQHKSEIPNDLAASIRRSIDL